MFRDFFMFTHYVNLMLMLRKLLFLFIVSLFCLNCYSQENKQAYQKILDSISGALPAVKIDSVKVDAYIKLARLSRFLAKDDDAKRYAEDALAISNQINLYTGKMSSYLTLAEIVRFKDEQKERHFLLLALQEAKQANRWKGIAFISRFIGINYQTTDFKTAESYFLQSAGAYLKHKKYNEYCEVGLELAFMYQQRNDLIKAVDLCNKVINVADKNNLVAHSGRANAFLLQIFSTLGSTDKVVAQCLTLLKKAEGNNAPGIDKCILYAYLANVYKEKKYLKKAKEFAYKHKNCKDTTSNKENIYLNNATTYLNEGNNKGAVAEYDKIAQKALKEKNHSILTNIAQRCFVLQDYSRALKYHRQALGIAKERKVAQPLAESEANVGATCITMAKSSKDKNLLGEGIALLEKSSKFYKTSFDYDMLAMVSDYLHQGYESAGNDKRALSNYKAYINYKDSVYNRANREKLIARQADFAYNEKEILLKANQKAALDKEQTNRNYAYAGIGIFVLISIGAGVAYTRKRKDNHIIAREKKRSDDLLLNILPAEVAEELKASGEAHAQQHEKVSIIFTDFVGFTKLSEKLTPTELIAELNYCFKAFDHITTKYNIEKIKTIGDSYMAVSGLPTANENHALNAVKAALEIRDFIVAYKEQREREGKVSFEMRIGINSGEVVAGIVGIKKFAYDIWGDAVNIASRMETNGYPGKVNISETTYNLVKDYYDTEYRGELDAKGKGFIKMYFAEPKQDI